MRPAHRRLAGIVSTPAELPYEGGRRGLQLDNAGPPAQGKLKPESVDESLRRKFERDGGGARVDRPTSGLITVRVSKTAAALLERATASVAQLENIPLGACAQSARRFPPYCDVNASIVKNGALRSVAAINKKKCLAGEISCGKRVIKERWAAGIG